MRFKGVSALHDSLGADFAGVHGTRSEVLQRRGWRFQVEASLFASAGLKARLCAGPVPVLMDHLSICYYDINKGDSPTLSI